MQYKFIRVSRKGGLLEALFDRPPANSLDLEMAGELNALLDAIEADPSVRCVLFGGRGKCFVAGADIKMIKAALDRGAAPAFMRKFNSLLQRAFSRIENYPLPFVAAIGGHAMGGGFELALACDIRYMAEGAARVGLPETTLGLLPGAGGCTRLARLVGPGRAKELILQGKILDARQAAGLGIISEVLPAEGFMDEARSRAAGLAESATRALGVVKRCVTKGFDMDVEGSLALEMEGLMELLETEDCREGVGAFVEKRKPEFKGK